MNKKSFRGSPKSSAPTPVAPYDPTTDPGYQRSLQIITALQPKMDAATKRMSPAEIIASLPALNQQLIQQQSKEAKAAPGADWGAINNYKSPVPQAAIKPVFAPQFQGSIFNGYQNVAPPTAGPPLFNASLLGQAPSGGK